MKLFIRFLMTAMLMALISVFMQTPVALFAADTPEDDQPEVCTAMCVDDPTTEEVECYSSCEVDPISVDIPFVPSETIDYYSSEDIIILSLIGGEEKWIGIKLPAGTYFMENPAWGALEVYELFAEDGTAIEFNEVNSIQVSLEFDGIYYLHLIAFTDTSVEIQFLLDPNSVVTGYPGDGTEIKVTDRTEENPLDDEEGEVIENPSEDGIYVTQDGTEEEVLTLTGSNEETSTPWLFFGALLVVMAGLIFFKILKPIPSPK